MTKRKVRRRGQVASESREMWQARLGAGSHANGTMLRYNIWQCARLRAGAKVQVGGQERLERRKHSRAVICAAEGVISAGQQQQLMRLVS